MRVVCQLGRNEHIGFLLEKDGVVLEDACWLQSANNAGYINLAKFNAVVNGVKLALQWQERSCTCAPIRFVSTTGFLTKSAVQCIYTVWAFILGRVANVVLCWSHQQT